MVESKKALPKEPRGFNFFAGHYGQPHAGGGTHGIHGHYYSPTPAYPRHIYGYSGGYGNQVNDAYDCCLLESAMDITKDPSYILGNPWI